MYSSLHTSPHAIDFGLSCSLLSTALPDYALLLAPSAIYPEVTQWVSIWPIEISTDLHSVCTALAPMGSISFFQQWLSRLFSTTGDNVLHDFIGSSVKVTQTIPVHGLGRVYYRGTEWAARTIAGKTHKPGDGVTIRRVEGIILIVE